MKSINEGPFHMGTVSDVIVEGTEGAVQQGEHLPTLMRMEWEIHSENEFGTQLLGGPFLEADECDAFRL
ncbi:hypothetical protein Tco_0800270 [Tanacetum coccineum]|uniref:Uncharacterized protein n=1 Tax=Tanacetum coccineum TaxID=301880 RepID=A0ABQ4ZTN7_9ASTR